jgi:CRISPR-associated endonuclease/helicase Cas3
MPVPLHILRRWWQAKVADDVVNVSDLTDVEGAIAVGEGDQAEGQNELVALRWLGPDESQLVRDPIAFRPGDAVILPVAFKSWEVFGHIPGADEANATIDVGDWAHREARGQAILRIYPLLVNDWPDCSARKQLLEIISQKDVPEGSTEILELLQTFVVKHTVVLPPWFPNIVDALTHDRHITLLRHPCNGMVLRGSKRLPRRGEDDTFTHEDESASATVPVPLADHCKGVEEFAFTYGQACGLPAENLHDLTIAALLHDIGKIDRRFQSWLHGGNAVAAEMAPRLLAKSGGLRSKRERDLARRRSGYPTGARHELLSVRIGEATFQLLQDNNLHCIEAEIAGSIGERVKLQIKRPYDPDLVLYLVGSYHGWCRPFAPVVEDPTPEAVTITHDRQCLAASSNTSLERIDGGVAERFWRLIRRYGWWGLAWLEALLILADHRCSEAEQNSREKKDQEQ